VRTALATARVLAALALAVWALDAGVADGASPPSSHLQWIRTVRRYARGERAAAVADLAAWTESGLAGQVAAVEEAARIVERCRNCPSLLDGLPLRAAVMLHWDRDLAERPAPATGDVEQGRRCPGPTAALAERLARVLSRDPASAGFAARFFRMAIVSCQWEACFADAEHWANGAIQLLPGDAELLLARGSAREELATIGRPVAAATVEPVDPVATDAAARRAWFEKARQDLAAALAIDPGRDLARLRLARVLWRLGEPESARRHLEAALSSPGPIDQAYLAHLFLGRIHQDAGRLELATAEYRLAKALRPTAASASTALSSALFLAGDPDAARGALREGLGGGGGRPERDPLWDYLVLNAAGLDELCEALRGESLE
jgi:tetratricopeptide (TPR) repeat protein